jgi:hypothetical protein
MGRLVLIIIDWTGFGLCQISGFNVTCFEASSSAAEFVKVDNSEAI